MQYLLPSIVHINHQPFLERGDGPIVSNNNANINGRMLWVLSTGFLSSIAELFIQCLSDTVLIEVLVLY